MFQFCHYLKYYHISITEFNKFTMKALKTYCISQLSIIFGSIWKVGTASYRTHNPILRTNLCWSTNWHHWFHPRRRYPRRDDLGITPYRTLRSRNPDPSECVWVSDFDFRPVCVSVCFHFSPTIGHSGASAASLSDWDWWLIPQESGLVGGYLTGCSVGLDTIGWDGMAG